MRVARLFFSLSLIALLFALLYEALRFPQPWYWFIAEDMGIAAFCFWLADQFANHAVTSPHQETEMFIRSPFQSSYASRRLRSAQRNAIIQNVDPDPEPNEEPQVPAPEPLPEEEPEQLPPLAPPGGDEEIAPETDPAPISAE